MAMVAEGVKKIRNVMIIHGYVPDLFAEWNADSRANAINFDSTAFTLIDRIFGI